MPASRVYGAVVGFLLAASVAFAGPPTHVESFTTTTYKDAIKTTANWDTSTGVLKPFAYSPTLVGTFGGLSDPRSVVVKGNLAFVVEEYNGFKVIDITNPESPVEVGSYNTGPYMYGLAVSGDIAIAIGTISQLQVISISDPTNPTLIGTLGEQGYAVAIAGDHAFVAGVLGLRVISITNPGSPTLVGQFPLSTNPTSIAVDGNFAYVGSPTDGIDVINIANPTSPFHTTAYPGVTYDLAVDGPFLYVADNSAGLRIFDIGTPFVITLLGEYSTPGNAYSVDVAGDIAFVTDNIGGLEAIDVTDPSNPSLVAALASPGIGYDIAVDGEMAYVTDDVAGLRAIHVLSRSIPALAASRSLQNSYDVKVAGNHAYVADDFAGLRIFDISNPSNPTIVSTYNTPGSARGLTIVGGVAFVADASSVQIVNVTNPASPTLIGSFGGASAWDIAVAGDIAVVANFFGAVNVYNITNLSAPTLLGSCSTPGDPIAVTIDGDYVYVADYGQGIQVINISNPATPTLVGGYPTPGHGYDVDVEGDVLYVASEGGGFLVFDITTPSIPTLIGSLALPHAPLGIDVRGDIAYVADAASGLELVDVSIPSSPQHVGSYDTPGQADGVAVAGEYAFVADHFGGMHVIHTLNHVVNSGIGQSLAVDNGSDAIVRARLSDVQTAGVSWQVSADAGLNWVPIAPNNSWVAFTTPGSNLVWRSTHTWAGLVPTVSELTLQWLHDFPVIDRIKDIANDQGKQVRVEWSRSGHDFVGDASQIEEYAIYRKIDPDLSVTAALVASQAFERLSPAARENALMMQAAGWDFLTVVPVRVEDHYAVVVPTLKDSTIVAGSYNTTFRVTALTGTPGIFFDSPPDSGYSLDNLAPAPPANLVAAYNTGNGNTLSWNVSQAADFQYHSVYRSTTQNFTPSPATLVHTTASTGWSDPDYDGGLVYYKVSTTDFSGNESNPSSPGTLTDVPGTPAPTRFAVYQNSPNPFNPSTLIRYDVPSGGGHAVLRIYDVSGRLVRTLVDGQQTEGQKSASWNGLDDRGVSVASGAYFYRFSASNFEQTRKMLLIK